jgi:DNA repair protein RecO (recombination protein O)
VAFSFDVLNQVASNGMEWTDEGIVVGVRRHGEASAIIDVMTVEHGRHMGLVRGGVGSRLRPVLQPGNSLRLVWRARLDEHLGNYMVEGLRLRAASFLDVPFALYGLTHLCALVRLLPERDPHQALHDYLEAILDGFGNPVDAAAHVARFELQLLAELGFGLDLHECAATGGRRELIYVSPKSGRAVSRAAGAAWHDKLLKLPAFLSADADEADVSSVSRDDLVQGFELTGFFLARYVLEPRGGALAEERAQFVNSILRVLPAGGSRTG